MINLPPDFLEVLQLLNENSVDYVLVGGYAVAYHGYPRFTGDIDILLMVKEQNAVNVVKALDQFGFGAMGLKKEDFLVNEQVIQLGVHPLRINLLTNITGVSSEQVLKNAIEVDIENLTIRIISKQDLIQNKKSTGRSKDKVDIEHIDK